MRVTRVARCLLSYGLCTLLAACHPSTPPSAGPSSAAMPGAAAPGAASSNVGGASTLQASAQLTYKPEVQVMETRTALQALKGQTHGGYGFVFDSNYAAAKALKPGDILLIKGLVARKVIASGETPDGIVVLTQGASITDVLKNGHISMHSSLHFKPVARHAETQPRSEQQRRMLELLQSLIPAQSAHAQAPEGIKLGGQDPLQMADHDVNAELHPASMTSQEIDRTIDDIKDSLESPYVKPFTGALQGWEVQWSATPADGKINLSLTLTKNVNGLIAKITGTGSLSDFEFINDMNIDSGSLSSAAGSALSSLKKAEGDFKNVNGKMDFNWEIGKDTPGGESEAQNIKLPGAISQSLAPLLDGLPLTLEVSAAIVTHPMLTGGKQYSQGSFHVSYDGYQHFKMDGGSLTSDGAMNGDTSADVPRNISAVAPFGVVIGFSAPQIDLVFGGAGMIHSEDIEKAAAWTDSIVDAAAKKLLAPDAYQTYKDSDFSFTKAADAFKNTNATLSFRIITSSTMTESGASQITPCSKSTVDFSVWVGASANALGISAGSLSKKVMDKTFEHINPPGTKLCVNL